MLKVGLVATDTNVLALGKLLAYVPEAEMLNEDTVDAPVPAATDTVNCAGVLGSAVTLVGETVTPEGRPKVDVPMSTLPKKLPTGTTDTVMI